MKKYWTMLCAGLVVFRIRLMLRVWRLPRVLVVLSPTRVMMARNDSVMDDVTYYVDCWPCMGLPGVWGIWFNFTVA